MFLSMEDVEESTLDVDAAKFMEKLNSLYACLRKKFTIVSWDYTSNLTEDNLRKKLDVGCKIQKKIRCKRRQLMKMNWTELSDKYLKRQFFKFSVIGPYALPSDLFLRHTEIVSQMQGTYGKAKICSYLDRDVCDLSLEPDIITIMANSRDNEELKHTWQEWRNSTGKKMRDQYTEYVMLSNRAAKLNNFPNTADMWLSEFEKDNFENDINDLWVKLRPLYLELHCYVRGKLIEFYGTDVATKDGLIYSHLLGNMWAQSWENIYNLSIPYPETKLNDVTQEMIKRDMTPLAMFQMAEEFFVSLGLNPMTNSFWRNSIIEKVEDREMICHASAWDFFDGQDYRIKMCTKVNEKDLQTVHHEMGHVQYSMQYKDQPAIFRDGANSAFHEAIGDLIGLSVMSPTHLNRIGLIQDDPFDQQKEINILYHSALIKVAALPFLYLVDVWRWKVFRGLINSSDYNGTWHRLRADLQGVAPPLPRSEEDFDPGSKYHVIADIPYARYFLASVLQFQLHKALCEMGGPSNLPLHRRTIYRDKEAGAVLASLLKVGSSEEWPDVMEAAGLGRHFSAEPLLEYYDPLYKWLVDYNREACHTPGWN